MIRVYSPCRPDMTSPSFALCGLLRLGLNKAFSSPLLSADATVQHGTMCTILYVKSKLSARILYYNWKVASLNLQPSWEAPLSIYHAEAFKARPLLPRMPQWSCSGGRQWRDVIVVGSSQLWTCLTAWMLSRACMFNLPGGLVNSKRGEKQIF